MGGGGRSGDSTQTLLNFLILNLIFQNFELFLFGLNVKIFNVIFYASYKKFSKVYLKNNLEAELIFNQGLLNSQ